MQGKRDADAAGPHWRAVGLENKVALALIGLYTDTHSTLTQKLQVLKRWREQSRLEAQAVASARLWPGRKGLGVENHHHQRIM
jgi:hypothetical protein